MPSSRLVVDHDPFVDLVRAATEPWAKVERWVHARHIQVGDAVRVYPAGCRVVQCWSTVLGVEGDALRVEDRDGQHVLPTGGGDTPVFIQARADTFPRTEEHANV